MARQGIVKYETIRKASLSYLFQKRLSARPQTGQIWQRSLLSFLLILAEDMLVCRWPQRPRDSKHDKRPGPPLMSSLYGNREPAGAATTPISTAFVI